jgi:gamma-glutamylcyclotransferase (GGCT)/AIG2-like uncharacterized protein YtfP/cation transport regulator ChaC
LSYVKLFVYGTLRKHEENHFLLVTGRCLAEQAWVYGELFDTGLGYPSMRPSASQKVYGELYEVHLDQFRDLDELEDYIPGRKDNLYDRVEQDIHTDIGSFNGFVYVSNRDDLLAKQILHGDWKLYRFMDSPPEKVLYYAYGSCMDDERFRLAKVDHFFQRIVGPALLKGYSMKYLLERPDGGRGDIIEDGGRTEGILYELPYEAVAYLFKREGFHGGLYRPVFLDIESEGRIYNNVLSFHVYNKREELAPPAHYAKEILRGAKGRLSEEYLKKLEGNIAALRSKNPLAGQKE